LHHYRIKFCAIFVEISRNAARLQLLDFQGLAFLQSEDIDEEEIVPRIRQNELESKTTASTVSALTRNQSNAIA